MEKLKNHSDCPIPLEICGSSFLGCVSACLLLSISAEPYSTREVVVQLDWGLVEPVVL